MRGTLVGLMALFGSSGALAQEMVGDPAKGEELFAGQCGGCHIIQNEAGEVLAGTGRYGIRDLYGIAGRVPGSFPDLFYSKLMRSYGESGVVWEEANFVAYVLDPPVSFSKPRAWAGRALWRRSSTTSSKHTTCGPTFPAFRPQKTEAWTVRIAP